MNIPQRFDALPAYSAGESLESLAARLNLSVEQLIKLDANENLYGPSPRAVQAL
jgi:histidinol-phosphate aminotransferase